MVAVGSHDTASAVVGVPMQTDDAAYVSLGTWALAGLELDAPVLTEEARRRNFTNEGGVDGTTRFLTNVMGTWLLSETLRTWGEADLAGMLRAAAAYDVPVPIVDVQDERFLPPGDMQARIGYWCDEHGSLHRRPGGHVRCIVQSIAAAIATALDRAASLAGRRIGVVHVVGGGAQNTLLCQAIADRMRAVRCWPDPSRRRPSATCSSRRAPPASSARPRGPACAGRPHPRPGAFRAARVERIEP